MIKVEVINENFTLERFNELKNIARKSVEEKGKLFKGDTFECDEKMADYLTGNNPLNKVVVKVIEVEPVKEAPKVEALTDNEEPEVFVGYTQVIEQSKSKKSNKKRNRC